MRIRQAEEKDLMPLLKLYMQLHDNPMPEQTDALLELWQKIIEDERHYIIIGEQDGKILSSCVIVVILNLTRGQRPYAVVENVITDEAYRGRGYASKILEAAKDIAQRHHCYKIMLLTGSKKEHTLRFYERAGYNRQDKTAFIQWLDTER